MGSILLLSDSYGPTPDGTVALPVDLAEALANHGWSVTVMAGAGPGGPRRPGEAETRNGVRVERIHGTGAGPLRPARRPAAWLREFGSAIRLLVRLPRAEVVVATMDPPMLGLAVLAIARVRGARAVLWLHAASRPRSARAPGATAAGEAADPGGRLPWRSRLAARWSDVIVAPGQRMAEALVAAGTPARRLVCIPDWTDTQGIQPIPAESNPFRAEHGLQEAFIVLCSGSLAHRRTCATVIDAAWLLREEAEVVFLVVGNGSERARVEADAWRFGLENVRFMDPLPASDLAQALSSADASLVTEDPAAAGLRIPEAACRSLASGRPVVFAGPRESEVARTVATARCGIVVSQDDPEGLASAVLRLRDHPDEAALMGTMARFAAVTFHDRGAATDHWHELLQEVLRSGVPEARGSMPRGSPPGTRPRRTRAVAVEGGGARA